MKAYINRRNNAKCAMHCLDVGEVGVILTEKEKGKVIIGVGNIKCNTQLEGYQIVGEKRIFPPEWTALVYKAHQYGGIVTVLLYLMNKKKEKGEK